MNIVVKENGSWKCSCGAVSGKNGIPRFLKRHPKLCADVQEKRQFSHELAAGTRSVEDVRDDRFDGLDESEETQVIRGMLSELLNVKDGAFTHWELGFLASIRAQFRLTETLSGPQKIVLGQIYAKRMH